MSEYNLPYGLELRFHPDERFFPTWYEGAERQNGIDCPCFVNRATHKFADGDDYPCVGYQWYFRENLAIGIHGILPMSEELGYHPHDVEAVYVLFDEETKQPEHVYFKAHGLGQGVWEHWDQCLRTEDGALIVYVAKNSHANYPRPGDIVRALGFANDVVGEDGQRRRITAESCIPAKGHEIADGIRIQEEIPLLANTNISEYERAHLATRNQRIRDRARNQYN